MPHNLSHPPSFTQPQANRAMNSDRLARLNRIFGVFQDECWVYLSQVCKVNVPTFVVIGSQSAGKSSVLRIFGHLLLPVAPDMCTKFITEFWLREGTTPSLQVQVIPDPSRSVKEQDDLRKWKSPSKSIDDLCKVIDAFGIRLGSDQGDSFKQDRLRITYEHEECPTIALVDTPGLIEIKSSMTQSDDDIAWIKSTINGFMDNSRCCVLAVVDASKDLSSQTILTYIQGDARAKRTMGIITKPDLLLKSAGNIARYAQLARNENDLYRAGLGWYFVRNRADDEADMTNEQLTSLETDCLDNPAFGGIPQHQKGAGKLREAVSVASLDWYEQELPTLLKDVDKVLAGFATDRCKLPHRVTDPQDAKLKLNTYLLSVQDNMKVELLGSPSATGIFGPTSVIGMNPAFGGSWLETKIATIAREAEKQLVARRSDFENLTRHLFVTEETQVNEAGRDLLHSASAWASKDPASKYGSFPQQAAVEVLRAEARKILNLLHTVYQKIVDFVLESLKHAINEQAINEQVPESLQQSLFARLADDVQKKLKSDVDTLLPLPAEQSQLQGPPQIQLAPSATRSLPDLWRAELEQAILSSIRPSTITPLGKQSPSLTLDRDTLVQSLLKNPFPQDAVALVVSTQCKDIIDNLCPALRCPTLCHRILAHLKTVCDDLLKNITDPEALALFRIPKDEEVAIDRLETTIEMCSRGMSLVNSLLGGHDTVN